MDRGKKQKQKNNLKKALIEQSQASPGVRAEAQRAQPSVSARRACPERFETSHVTQQPPHTLKHLKTSKSHQPVKSGSREPQIRANSSIRPAECILQSLGLFCELLRANAPVEWEKRAMGDVATVNRANTFLSV